MYLFSNANKQFNINLVAEKAGDFSTEWEGMMILQDNNIIAGHSWSWTCRKSSKYVLSGLHFVWKTLIPH